MNEAQLRWVATCHIMACNKTDFDEIETDVRQLCSGFNVVSAGYDPWQYAQMARTQTGGDVAPRGYVWRGRPSRGGVILARSLSEADHPVFATSGCYA
jgi:hypothetical protein